MNKLVMSKTKLTGNQTCQVVYHQENDLIELEVGGTTLKLAAINFLMMNEMMRKAAAKLIMQTPLHEAEFVSQVLPNAPFLSERIAA